MRLIARLDIKNHFVIKGIHLEGLRKVGDPNELALDYYQAGVDELLMMDVVASLYDRSNLYSVLEKASKDVFVPITIGGGLRDLDDVKRALDAGADKVAINTAAVKNPLFIEKIAGQYGSQCVVASIEAKKLEKGWEAYTECGREKTGLSVTEWSKELQNLGAGEILITSIDQDGTRNGFDIDLAEEINDAVSIPVIISGGYGNPKHLENLFMRSKPSAVCFASALHYKMKTISELRCEIEENEHGRLK